LGQIISLEPVLKATNSQPQSPSTGDNAHPVLDFPAGEQQERYLPFNPPLQELPAHTIASNFKEAMHWAFPELSQGAAIFDTLNPCCGVRTSGRTY
jgi:hypothetical protein